MDKEKLEGQEFYKRKQISIRMTETLEKRATSQIVYLD